MEEKSKLLKLMRFWLFSTFIIVFVAVNIYAGIFANQDWMLALTKTFPIWGITGVLCIIWFFVYKAILKRRSE